MKKINLKLKIFLILFINILFGGINSQILCQSPYINKVYEYHPAPGQFINKMPEYEIGDNYETILAKVNQAITGENKGLISLGGFGGYVIFGFDHTVENKSEKFDFRLWGNAFLNYNSENEQIGGSSEPGIVFVAYDANKNGLPDDKWFELAGSEYYKIYENNEEIDKNYQNVTIKNYKLTYFKPNEDKIQTPSETIPTLKDTSYILWRANYKIDDNFCSDSGYISRNGFYSQPYYPLWISAENSNEINEKPDSLVFENTRLANNYIDKSGNGTYYVQYAYAWGYADNQPNSGIGSCFDIGWAVDSEGNSINLQGIDFVKVATGINQYCGWLGEASTEIMGAEDLHFQGEEIDVPSDFNHNNSAIFDEKNAENELNFGEIYYSDGKLHIINFLGYNCEVFTVEGKLLKNHIVTSDNDIYELNFDNYGLNSYSGAYFVKLSKENKYKVFKIIKLRNN